MGKIVPRWEWRLFAKQIDVRIDLEAFEKTRHAVSSETYLVSAASTANPKIRDGMMDIKTLERVNDAGLEQWKPAMKARFPLTRDQVITVHGALGRACPDLDQTAYPLEEFLALIRADERIRAVHVEKSRDQYDIEGCTVELCEATFDGDSYKTAAAENASQELVVRTVEMLGLQNDENMSYVRFIKKIKGLIPTVVSKDPL